MLSKRTLSLVMACLLAVSVMPGSLKVKAEESGRVIFTNDFETSKLPDTASGVISRSDLSIVPLGENNKALKFKSKFDGGDDWDSNKHEFAFNKTYVGGVSSNARIEFDILIPTEEKNFKGLMKYNGGFSTLDSTTNKWGWASAKYGDIKSDEFEDLGNGYSKRRVKMKVEDAISVDIRNITVQIDAYNCNYTGDIYIDNLSFYDPDSEPIEENKTNQVVWDFNDSKKGLNGWSFEDVWDHKGETTVSYDNTTLEDGAMKVGLDFSKDANVSWSEVKLNQYSSTELDFNKLNKLSFDLYYNPSCMTTGTFMAKLFAAGGVNVNANINLSDAKTVKGGLKKVTVNISFNPVNTVTNGFTLGLVGCKTDYKGNMFIDNVNLYKSDAKDIYVDKTTEVTDNPTMVDVDKLDVDKVVSLVDSNATSSTADLLAYLKAMGKSKYTIFGHQNDTHHKAVLQNEGTNSDVKDITGSIAGVCGMDSLSFTGAELNLGSSDKRTPVEAAADVSKAAADEGAIVTLSCHMPNFSLVKDKPLINGKHDFTGYTPNVTTGNVVSRVLPGGDLNGIFNEYLDMVADYGNRLAKDDVSVLFRPFHENNGSWFWWGGSNCDAEAYKNMYRYTVEYLRDVKNVHNFLYVYSPNGPFNGEDEYLSRYPGDAYIDVTAFDMYNDNPTKTNTSWLSSFKETVALVDSVAEKHNKLPAVSETGIRITESDLYECKNTGLAPSGNLDKDWFSEIGDIVSESDMPYYLVWANFDGTTNFFTPYMVSDTRGHEMINEFINFYNDDKVVFANGNGDYRKLDVTIADPSESGFITSPASGSRILNATTIKASVKNAKGEVAFVIKDREGNVLDTIKASEVNGVYEGKITDEVLKKVGQRMGTINLYSGDKLLCSNKAIFNIKEVEEKIDVVDDFEGYGDEDSLLQDAWTTNAGLGCSIEPTLEKDKDGNHKLKFNYTITTEKSDEGWAGIVKPKDVDWSNYDALQFYCTPDGNGQKLVIQITCNGEDFEVHMPEFAGTTEGKLVTIPFSEFKGKQNGKFDPSHIEQFGIWCNTIPKNNGGAWTVNSSMTFDNLKAVKMGEKEILYGDVTGDGDVNVLDLVLLKRYIEDNSVNLPGGIKVADLNGDNEISSVDFILLKKYISDKLTKFPVEK